MREQFTPGAQRALDRAQARARHRGSAFVETTDLLAALADEDEGRAGVWLIDHGLDPAALYSALKVATADAIPEDDAGPFVPNSMDLRTAVNDASSFARQWDRNHPVGTEHLLSALLQMPGEVPRLLGELGLETDSLLEQLNQSILEEIGPLPMDPEHANVEITDPGQEVDLARIFDASANRAREGLRVIEDYVRFALDDPMLTKRFKDVRHRLAQTLRGFAEELLIGGRDTTGDVGTRIMAVDEQIRENPRAVLVANFKRVGEALRSLEEYAKLVNVWVAGRFEVLRYDLYTLEKLTAAALTSREGLGNARLYVLVGGLPTQKDLLWVVGEALAGGADVIQLREKGLPDRILLERAREVRILTAKARARFILNDRPDIARLAGADGVHLGQDDLKVRDARRIVGTSAHVGVSTHTPAQIEQAVLDAAGYLGVGPVFPSETKSFGASELAGLEFVRDAAEATTLPWFALGGIDERNLDRVLDAGARRIAVSNAVVKADSPRQAAERLRRRLDALG